MRPDPAPKSHPRLRLLAALKRLPPPYGNVWHDAFIARYDEFLDPAEADEWAARNAAHLERYLAGDKDVDELLPFE